MPRRTLKEVRVSNQNLHETRRQIVSRCRKGEFRGSESMDFLAGQAVGLVREIKPAGEIIREVAAQAEDILAARLPTITACNICETRKRRKGA